MTTEETLKTVADEFAAAFETKTRDDDSRYVTRKDDCAPWIDSEVCRTIHEALDDRLPNDWVYEKISAIADSLTEYDSLDDMREAMHEIADSNVDIYNGELLQWLASNVNNAWIVDEACEEFGSNDMDTIKRIQVGQYWAIDKIGHAVINALEAELESRD